MTITPDHINAFFECSGLFFVFPSIIALYRTKSAEAISLWTVFFFTSWGFWNMWYYPSLGQFWSGVGAYGVAGANSIWLGLIIYYKKFYAKRKPTSTPISTIESAHLL